MISRVEAQQKEIRRSGKKKPAEAGKGGVQGETMNACSLIG
jgi:hypothetical protein